MSEVQRSIALVDLFARSDGFLGDARSAGLNERLVRAGHRVQSWLRARPEAVDPSAWISGIAEELSATPFDLVALFRVWDVDMVNALRRGLRPSARLVRIANEPSPHLDAAFDHVVDDEGLIALASGAHDVPAPEWRKIETRALRERVRAALPVLAAATDGEMRPTMTGPAMGCPFLLDARSNPRFAALALDANHTQTHGCTFCLDNTGAYAMPDATQTVESWLAQWRAIRAARPGAREVLLTDERPHPFLPRFFAAIEREPELAPIELMIKSRVDWLLEFADTALTEAIEAAARTGSVLHLYLVGFENFDAEHLELFNKGYDVEANVRAIETLRRLGERFPDAFEYRRYRAHGIVLFTPWTSPESLLENARWMRKVRFDEVRAEAVRTRLRLYPRLPLYALAEREGLLLTEWPPGRTDRAFEQGYDASTPWRFRDPRTEAIYQAANALHEHAPELTDADVLEATVRFVLRWPALGAAPRRAPRALILATAAWNVALDRAAREFGAAALALNPWLAALAAGAIEVVARTDLDEATVAEAAAALAAMGFVVAQVPGSQAAARLARPIRPEATVLLVTRSAERLHGAVDPECCVAAYRAGSHPARGLDDERAMLLRSPAEPLDPMLNRLGAIALTTHQPCSPSCAASRALAERLLATFDPETRNGVMAALRRSVLALDDGRRAELEGIWRGDAFEVRASRPFRPHDAAFAADLKRVQLETSGVVAERSNGVVERIDAPRPLLITPGETMTAEALRAIRAHLPPAFRQKTRVAGYEITSVDAQGAEYAVVLGRSERRISLRIRPYDPSRPATVRRGAWAVDVPDVAALDAPAREAIRVLIAALPA